MRRFLLPLVLAAAALVVWFAPTHRTIDAFHQGESTPLEARCAAAPVDLFRYGVSPDTAGTYYDRVDGSGVFAPEGPCRPAAWWRTALGALLVTAAAYLVLREYEPTAAAGSPPAEELPEY